MTGITAAIPYAFSALAQISWRWHDHQRGAHAALLPGPVGGRGRSRGLDRVHLLLPQHRELLVRRLGTVPDGRRRLLVGIPVYLRDAQHMTRAGRRAGLSMTTDQTNPAHREATMTFHVDSEVGQLKQVIVHRPGLELSRLTPDNVDELLFDDVMWAERAREEHDVFVGQLEAGGVLVHEFADPARGGARRSPVHGRSSRSGSPRRPVRSRARRAPRRARGVYAGGPAGQPADRWRAQARRGVAAARAEPADGLPRPGRLPPAPAAQPPVPARQLGLDLRRGLDQPDGQASAEAGDDQLPGGLQLPPDVRARRG